jgi:hypothetical protein
MMMVPALPKGMAVASMVLGIVGIVFIWVPFLGLIAGVLAVILGAVALNGVKSGQAGGGGMAITGLVLGIVDSALWLLLILFMASW